MTPNTPKRAIGILLTIVLFAAVPGGRVALAQERVALAQESDSYLHGAPGASAPATGQPIGALPMGIYGSVPAGTASNENLALSLNDAVDRGLRNNLGPLFAGDAARSAEGDFWLSRSSLLPNLSAKASENASQVNLAALGIRFPGVPVIVGPFGFVDIRASLSQKLLDLNALDNKRAAADSLSAANYQYQDIREMVVLVVAQAYLEAVASQARVTTAEAQVQTAQALFNLARDQKEAGVSAGIDVLRAQVELQAQQQQLIAARNDFSKQKLALARIIGLPLAQPFTLSDTAPYEAPTAATVESQLQLAYAARQDLLGAQARVAAAEATRRAATAEHYPSLTANADYGIIGPVFNQTHGTFTVSGAMNIPIFAGGRAHGDALIADAALARGRQELDNLRAQIEHEIRTALLDLQSASDQVAVAQSSMDLAQQTLTQARDRFQAGATNNIEVVQAQESVVRANDSYISSLYAYNLARVRLARAIGATERSVREYWKGK
jgi:outer membrane protein TolC